MPVTCVFTKTNARSVCMALVLSLYLVNVRPIDGKYCTFRQSKIRRNNSVIYQQCRVSYTESCGFLDFYSSCTYYRMGWCERQLNFTYTYYYTVTGCCAGYYWTKTSDCRSFYDIKEGEDLPYHVLKQRELFMRKQQRPHRQSMTPGVYAGIAAASAFILCIVIIPIVIARKKKLKMQAARFLAGKDEQMVQLFVTDVDGAVTAHQTSVRSQSDALVEGDRYPMASPDSSDDGNMTGGQADIEIYNNVVNAHLSDQCDAERVNSQYDLGSNCDQENSGNGETCLSNREGAGETAADQTGADQVEVDVNRKSHVEEGDDVIRDHGDGHAYCAEPNPDGSSDEHSRHDVAFYGSDIPETDILT